MRRLGLFCGAQPGGIGPETIDRAVPGDADEPAGRGAKGCVVGLCPRPCLDEYFLKYLFSVAAFLQDPEEKAEEHAAVPIVQLAECWLVAGDDAAQQRDVDACFL